MHTPAQDPETLVLVLTLLLNCCVTLQKTHLPLTLGTPPLPATIGEVKMVPGRPGHMGDRG